jgi:hypothetical protein
LLKSGCFSFSQLDWLLVRKWRIIPPEAKNGTSGSLVPEDPTVLLTIGG